MDNTSGPYPRLESPSSMTSTNDGDVFVPGGDASCSGVDQIDDCIVVSAPPYLQEPVRSKPKRRGSYACAERRVQRTLPQEQACLTTHQPTEHNPLIPQISTTNHLLLPRKSAQGASSPQENVALKCHNADPSWLSQCCGQWDPRTESFLRAAITRHNLFADPTKDPEDLQKMGALYDQFYKTVDFQSWKPPRNDPNLWLLFTTKITNVRAAMVRDGEVVQVKEGLKLSAKHNPGGNSPGPSFRQHSPYLPTSTPPTPPMYQDSMPYKMIIDSWAVMDANEQLVVLGELMRTAKDCTLMNASQMELAEKLSLKNGVAGHRPPQLADTSPVDQPSMDMKTIIQECIRKKKLQRYLEKRTPESDAENGSSKRARLESDQEFQKLEAR